MIEKNVQWASLTGILSSVNAYAAANKLMDYVNTKAIVLQSELAKFPELTEQVYENAKEIAENVAKGDYHMGFFFAGVAAFAGVASLYNLLRKDKE